MSTVPCNGCRACCREQIVVLMPEDEQNLSAYEYEVLNAADPEVKVLKRQPNGDCIHLGPQGCAIYDRRPEMCRAYDCRMQFKIMSRGERRQLPNQEIWKAARARLSTLDASDLAGIARYHNRASAGFQRASGDDR